MNYSKTLLFFASFTLILIVFRSTLALLFGAVIAFLPFLLVYLSLGLYFFRGFNFGGSSISLLFVLYLLLLIPIYPLFGWYGNYLTAFIGFTNLAMPLLFWGSFHYNKNFACKIVVVIYVMLLINAIGAVIQYYYSPTLFGLISHNVYSDESVTSLDNVLKRAISFISAPQSLSISMGVGVSLTFYFFTGLKRYCLASVFLLAGILTISKAFYLYLMVMFFWSYRHYFLKVSALFLFGVIGISFLPEDNVLFRRILQIKDFIFDLQSYSAYKIWETSILYVADMYYFIFGRGVGVFSRGSQSILDYSIYTGSSHDLTAGSTESFLIQLLVESGFLGLTIWMVMVYFSIKVMIKNNVSNYISSIIVSITFISLFTPALYGFVIGFLFYFFLVFGRCFDGKN